MRPSGSEATARAEAKRLIKSIFEGYGGIDQDIWERLEKFDPEVKEKIAFAQRKKDEIAASSIRTLATQLYSDPSRFIFEVLQNAEDNHYTYAEEHGEKPYISFQVYYDRIIIDCNEDGFDERNVKAICNVGNSSKRDTQGYIGAKGIGFKSVFFAAWKVHIQSGYYSFYFKYRKGDNDLGMVTPIWEDPAHKLPAHMTRMTLFLHDTGDPALLSSQRQKIEKQFDGLNESVLVFMSKLKEVRISFPGRVQRSTTFSVSRKTRGRPTVTRTNCIGKETIMVSYYYHVTKVTVDHLPEHKDRQQSSQEGQSEVILAFPIDQSSRPVIEHQHVFAFLPVRPMGFSFLIQGDFETEASRQDIVEGSPRNERIVEHISHAFIQAVLELCKHDNLRYTWMRFLPAESYPYSGLWKGLVGMIREQLKSEAVLSPRSESRLSKIEYLRTPCASYCDAKGDPLFRDVEPEMWMSKQYEADDIQILESWGLQTFSTHDLLKMVRQDLSLPDSRMKSEETDDNWHTRAVTMLTTMASEGKILAALRQLELLPCRGSPTNWISWKSAAYPNTMISLAESEEGIPVPHGLDLRVITSKASRNPKRVAFFKRLGFTFVKTATLRRSVFLRHLDYRDLPIHTSAPDVQVVVDQLKFLYLTQHTDPKQEHATNEVIVMDEACQFWVGSNAEPLYLSNKHPYGPRELLRITKAEDTPGAGAPGMGARFLHSCFLSDHPRKPTPDSESWLDWLQSYAGVHSSLRLIHLLVSQPKPSPECYYVAKHRPEKFLGLLRHHWLAKTVESREWSILGEKLRTVEVLCQGNLMVPFEKAYLPLSDLQETCCSLLTEDHAFPFLELEEDISRETYTAKNWDFLVDFFGVRVKEDLDFYLAILDDMRNSEEDGETADRVIQLYSKIYTQYANIQCDGRDAERKIRITQQEQIKRAFKDTKAIYIPKNDMDEAHWAPLGSCLWNGPPQLPTMYPLRTLYQVLCDEMIVEFNNVERLFCDVLGIPDCKTDDLVRELEHLHEDDNHADSGGIGQLYEYFWSLTRGMDGEEQRRVRKRFNDGELIYVPPERDGQREWHKLEQCLWSSKTRIGTKATLMEHYENLKPFFVDFLGVGTLTLSIVHDELIRLGSSKDVSVDDTRDQIMSLNSFLMEAKPADYPSASRLAKAKILPVRDVDGTVSLASPKSDFVIVDRIHFGEIFANQVKTLDFSFDEVCRLKAFIEYLGIDEKRLSETVKERTKVDEDDIQPLLRFDRQIGPKAYALYRVALHYGSPRLESGHHILYNTLRQAQVYTTEGISSKLELRQGANITPLKARVPSDLHVREHEGKLEIFVSRKKKKQDLVYSSRLNSQLLRWLMTDTATNHSEKLDPRALLTVQKILNSRPSGLKQVLEEDGIVTGAIEDLYQNMQTDGCSVSESSSDGENLTHPAKRSKTYHVDSGGVNEEAVAYGKALRNIVLAARSSRFPNAGQSNMSSMSSALVEGDNRHPGGVFVGSEHFGAFDDASPFERDRKIGAAGELYVFELLKKLELPDFTINQWQSNLRHYVAAHPEYTGITTWTGEETSDLTYHDVHGKLTRLLIDTGYLVQEIWQHRRPMYFLEVKTTLGQCRKPFFMSSVQFERMDQHKDSTDSVSLVFRVFGVGSGNIGLKVFLNPAELVEGGQLIFETHTWSVVEQ